MIGEMELRAIWLSVANHLWLAGILVGLFALVDRYLLTRSSARQQGLLWTLGLLVLCVPATSVSMQLRSLASADADPLGTVVVGPVLERTIRPIGPEILAAPEAAADPGTGWLLITLIWSAGGAVLLVRTAKRAVANHRLLTKAGALPQSLADAATDCGIDADFVRVIATGDGPYTTGLLKPRIAIPAALAQELDRHELAAVLVHERCHARRRDPLRLAAYRLVLAALWFYPPAWFVIGRLARAAEIACDEAVRHAGISASTYLRAISKTLRASASARSQMLAEPAMARSSLKHRLHRIQNPQESNGMIRNIVAPALIVSIVTVTIAVVPPVAGTSVLAQEQQTLFDTNTDQAAELLGLRGVGTAVTHLAHDASLSDVLDRVAEMGGFDVEFVDFTPEQLAADTLKFSIVNGTIGHVLLAVAASSPIRYEVVANDRLVITPHDGSDRPNLLRDDAPITIGPEATNLTWNDQGFRYDHSMDAPTLIKQVDPEYPRLARNARLEGEVFLEVTIGPDGTAQEVSVLRGLGLGLDEASIRAVRQWEWEPPMVDGQAGTVQAVVTVSFRLNNR